MSEIKIRLLNSNDYIEFLNIIQQFRDTKFTQEQFCSQLEKINKYSEIWVAELDNKIIGTGTIIYEHKFIFNLSTLAHIEDVCVDKQLRGKGIGKQIVKFLMQRSKDMNCYKVVLDCAENNVPFYLKCGLEQRGLQMSQIAENI